MLDFRTSMFLYSFLYVFARLHIYLTNFEVKWFSGSWNGIVTSMRQYVPTRADPGHMWTKIVKTKWDKKCESRIFYWSNLAVLLTYCRTKELRCTNKTRLRTSVTHLYMYGAVRELTAIVLHKLWQWIILDEFTSLLKSTGMSGKYVFEEICKVKNADLLVNHFLKSGDKEAIFEKNIKFT